jgi:hypothetical protein
MVQGRASSSPWSLHCWCQPGELRMLLTWIVIDCAIDCELRLLLSRKVCWCQPGELHMLVVLWKSRMCVVSGRPRCTSLQLKPKRISSWHPQLRSRGRIPKLLFKGKDGYSGSQPSGVRWGQNLVGRFYISSKYTIGNQQLTGSNTAMLFQEMPRNAVTNAGKHVPSNPDQYHPFPLSSSNSSSCSILLVSAW